MQCTAWMELIYEKLLHFLFLLIFLCAVPDIISGTLLKHCSKNRNLIHTFLLRDSFPNTNLFPQPFTPLKWWGCIHYINFKEGFCITGSLRSKASSDFACEVWEVVRNWFFSIPKVRQHFLCLWIYWLQF